MHQESFIYKFLLSPKFRVWRYIALLFIFSIVSCNQAFAGYKKIMPQMGNNVYWIVVVTILSYIIVVYFFSRIAVKYLLSTKYIRFIICIIICALIFTTIPNLVFAYYIENYDIWSEYVFIDNLSAFALYLLCISGIIIPIFLKNWILSNQHLNELKTKQESSQKEQLKEQINPTSFFKILNKSGSLVKIDPDKASAMLMKLGQLLRYQLYDCNRTQVLLSAEISFLRNFLDMENLYSSEHIYTINTTGNANGILIYPSILLPFVQGAINSVRKESDYQTLNIHIDIHNHSISVMIKICHRNNISLNNKELLNIKNRLDTVYKNRYKLNITNSKTSEETEINLILERS